VLATAMLKLYQHGPAMLERTHEFPGSDDILPMLEKVGGILVKSEEYVPDVGKETMSNEELNKER